jgi:hypothetical protein
MSVLKYIAIAGAAAIGIVLVKRALQPATPQVPTSSPLSQIVDGVKSLGNLLAPKAPTTTGTSPSGTGTLSPSQQAARSADCVCDSGHEWCCTSVVGPLGNSPFAVVPVRTADGAAAISDGPGYGIPLATIPQPSYFTLPDQRAIAGVSPTSLYRVPTTVART